VLIVATIVCAVACLALIDSERRAAHHLLDGVDKTRAQRDRVVTKTIASLAFVAVALLATSDGKPLPDDYRMWITVGLAAGVLGDVFLLGKSSNAFLAGLVAFLIGHVLYVVACADLVPIQSWANHAGAYGGIPGAIGAGVLVWLWPRLGGMRIPVLLYVVTIIAMVVGAIAVYRAGALPECNGKLLCAGAVLFFVSDLAVARDKFVSSGFINRAWGLPAYYAGQLLIAWSLH
jgi:uncharacterized membrane protein YhhN